MKNKIGININKISDKSKRSFKQRFISSFFIIGFFVLSFVFSILSDTKFGWFPIDNLDVKQAFAYFQLFLLIAIALLAAKEIYKLHFYHNYLVLTIIIVSMLSCILGAGLIFIFNKFNYFVISEIDYFYILIITCLSAGSLFIIINILCFWWQGLLSFKKVTTHLILISLVTLFCISWLYFSNFRGWTTLFLIYIITALTDVFAYVCGMFFGKRKMSPYISPNKTIGGGVGGILLTTIIAIIVLLILSLVPNQYNILGNFFGIKFKYLHNWVNNNVFSGAPLWWLCIIFIIPILSVISLVGDLSFSYIKRIYKIKDFSNLIPGHGGVLDRLDSLSFTFSAYFIFTLFISLFSSSVGLF